ncbi:hypothetical protein PPL_06595 [Heterostelium album PN500]|uniref:Uncharacterized protein n=1 Tax=Heterostelium pallidum (strain ATCC 26659 / Pp 5 / PN500) TaxID=670386 RepID=D3BF62_HETP5|nr:hypothetical protein PPL_06595 [Heterostelium album PN500]EFA79776.1 hypothetical protein PPL_06595 [Heterostelium album PN500]|eukprot:XP_020431897.1 hypothetical protein PPL_06595 [Heterostelium album PN500]
MNKVIILVVLVAVFSTFVDATSDCCIGFVGFDGIPFCSYEHYNSAMYTWHCSGLLGYTNGETVCTSCYSRPGPGLIAIIIVGCMLVLIGFIVAWFRYRRRQQLVNNYLVSATKHHDHCVATQPPAQYYGYQLVPQYHQQGNGAVLYSGAPYPNQYPTPYPTSSVSVTANHQ